MRDNQNSSKMLSLNQNNTSSFLNFSTHIRSDTFSIEVWSQANAVSLRLTHVPTGRVWIDGPLVYRIEARRTGERGASFQLTEANLESGNDWLVIRGKVGSLSLSHRFCFDGTSAVETIEIQNTGKSTFAVERLEIGLCWPLTGIEGKLLETAKKAAWVPIPGRRHPMDMQQGYEQFDAQGLISRKPDLWFCHQEQGEEGEEHASHPADGWVADGWCFTLEEYTLVVLKHCEETYEFSVLDSEELGGRYFVRLGGSTLIHLGDSPDADSVPGEVATVPPGKTVRLGVTRYEVVQGGWEEGYAVFRRFFDSEGYVPPRDFNPPLHWNQLYDMTSWYTTRGYSDRRQELYTLEALCEEARKAREYHCEALYLDPGWDTAFGSAIWDEGRLGSQKQFSERLESDYGLVLSLHCPLAFWSDASCYATEVLRMDEQGRRVRERICSGSKQYLEVKAQRFKKLCQDGAVFLMYDGTNYTGPCFDPEHGHPIPYTVEDHARSYVRLCDVVQERYPSVLIELHDVYFGGSNHAITPKHFPHKPMWNVENWGNEYMWLTYEDLYTGKMKYLDYVNRAYSIPMYLHVSLVSDNEHGLAFWYAASTCRHLGIGGTHPNPPVAESHKAHVAKYLKLKQFFTQGRYFAVDENTHLHVLPDVGEGVLLLFNFRDTAILRSEAVSLDDEVGLSGDLIGSPGVRKAKEKHVLFVHVLVPAWGVRVILLQERDRVNRKTMIW